MKARKIKIGLGVLLVGLRSVAVPVGFVWRTVQKEQRNGLLLQAVERADENAVTALLSQGANPNAPVWQMQEIYWQRLQRFLKRQSPPGKPISPTQAAIGFYQIRPKIYNNRLIIRLLVEYGANPNLITEDKEPLLPILIVKLL